MRSAVVHVRQTGLIPHRRHVAPNRGYDMRSDSVCAEHVKQTGEWRGQAALYYAEPRPEAGICIVERTGSHKSQKSARAVAAPATRYIGHGPNASSKDAFFGFRHKYM